MNESLEEQRGVSAENTVRYIYLKGEEFFEFFRILLQMQRGVRLGDIYLQDVAFRHIIAQSSKHKIISKRM